MKDRTKIVLIALALLLGLLWLGRFAVTEWTPWPESEETEDSHEDRPKTEDEDDLPAPRLSQTEAIAMISARFDGRALKLRMGRPDHHAGVVYDILWISPTDDILRFRVDADTGRILDIQGRGLTQARRKTKDH